MSLSTQRITLGALVVIDVHARDIVARMCDITAEGKPVGFEWARYYI